MVPGPPHQMFRQAIEAGDLPRVRMIAREMPTVSLADALSILALICVKQPQAFERAAVRWIARFAAERRPSIDDLGHAIDAIDAMRDDVSAVRSIERLC